MTVKSIHNIKKIFKNTTIRPTSQTHSQTFQTYSFPGPWINNNNSFTFLDLGMYVWVCVCYSLLFLFRYVGLIQTCVNNVVKSKWLVWILGSRKIVFLLFRIMCWMFDLCVCFVVYVFQCFVCGFDLL